VGRTIAETFAEEGIQVVVNPTSHAVRQDGPEVVTTAVVASRERTYRTSKRAGFVRSTNLQTSRIRVRIPEVHWHGGTRGRAAGDGIACLHGEMKGWFVGRVPCIPAVSDQHAESDGITHADDHSIMSKVAVERGCAIFMLNHEDVVESSGGNLSIEMGFLDVQHDPAPGGSYGCSNCHQEVVPESRRTAVTIARC
jgi:hypothetical protein